MASVDSAPSTPASSLTTASDSEVIDEDDVVTVDAVDWDELAHRAQKYYDASSSTWGKYFSGAYNVVRFLYVGSTIVVARVPRKPAQGFSDDELTHVRDRLQSEVATMQFVEDKTTIPAPRVIESCCSRDGDGVGLPYILMTHVEGVVLGNAWNSMEDATRTEIIRQVVSIYLELDKHRFDHIGSIFCEGRDPRRFIIGEPVCGDGGEDHPSFARALDECTDSTSQADFWLSCAEKRLRYIEEMDFGSDPADKTERYAFFWLVRSYIPTLYRPTSPPSILHTPFLSRGFRLYHGDFDYQNIMVDGQRIAALIDWEYSGTAETAMFAEYPLFILDDPRWSDNLNPDPYAAERERNRRDQSTFLRILRAEEVARGLLTVGDRLSDAFEISDAVRVAQRLLQSEEMDLGKLDKLFTHMYRQEATVEEPALNIAFKRISRLTNEGELYSMAERFVEDAEILQEAKELLGDVFEDNGSKTEFIQVIRRRAEELNDDLKEWLSEQH